MTEREKFEANEKKEVIYVDAQGFCQVCFKWITIGESQLAHRISKSDRNIRKYGKEVIHHKKNLVLVCSDRFGRCNDSVNITNKPIEVIKLVSEIRVDLTNEQEAKIEK